MLGLATYGAILAALAVGTWIRPAIGVAAVLCLYGLKQWGQNTTAFIVEHGQLTNFAVFGVATVGLLRAYARRSCIICQWPSSARLVFALLLYALASVVWSPNLELSFEQWLVQGPYVLTITLLAPLLLDNESDVRSALAWTGIAGAAICILALAFGKWGLRGLLIYGDNHDWETNPLALSSLAGTVFVICSLSLGPPNRLLFRLLSLACIPITLAVVLRSGSRGQLLASGAAVLIALPIAFRIRDGRSVAALILAAALIVGLGSWGASLVEIDTTRWEGAESEGAVIGRLDNALILLDAASGQFGTIIFGLGNSSAFDILGIYPHIAGLEILAEEGLVGAALYVAIIVVTMRSIRRIASDPEMTEPRRHAVALLTALFAFELILSWKQGSLLSSVYVFMYSIALARLEGSAPSAKDRPEPHVTPQYVTPRFPMLLR